jgi:WD40 repeat protein
MARDMRAFVATFASVISQSAAHIYLSGLAFALPNSVTSREYMSHYSQTLVVETGGLSTWPATQSVLTGHSDTVCSVAFSPDGRRVVSGSDDSTIRIWDAETGETMIGPLQGHSDSVTSVAVSPDGRRVVFRLSRSDDSNMGRRDG